MEKYNILVKIQNNIKVIFMNMYLMDLASNQHK